MGKVIPFSGRLACQGASKILPICPVTSRRLLRPHPVRGVNLQTLHPRLARHLLGRRLRCTWLDHVDLNVYRREVVRVASGAVTLDEAEARVVIESALAQAERAGVVEHFTNRKF